MVRPPSHQLAVAPATSLEGRSFAGRQADAIFVTRNKLHAAGTIPARSLGINFISAPWDEVLDGLVILREERSPTALNPR